MRGGMLRHATPGPVQSPQRRFQRQAVHSKPHRFRHPDVRDAKGQKRKARIEIGQPQPVPGDKDQNWFCPLYIQDWTCFPAIGIGPLDSLMNAVTILRGFHDHVGGMHITYATSKPKRRRRVRS